MQTKIILFFLLIIISGFFYLHTVNPAEVTFHVVEGWTFVLPVTVILFAGFIIGVALVVINTIIVDARRVVREIKSRKKEKAIELAEENHKEGISALLKVNPARAIKLLEKAHKQNPSNRESLFYLSRAYLAEGRNLEALAVIERELSKNPEDLQLLFGLVDVAEKTEDADKAERILEVILRVDKDNPDALSRLREIKISAGDWVEAARLQKKFIAHQKQPTDDDARVLAACYYESALRLFEDKSREKADEKIRKSLKADSGFVPSLILSGEIRLGAGESDEAVRIWEDAFETTKDAVFFLRLEDVYLSEANPQKILAAYRSAIDADPSNVRLRALLSRLYLKLEMVDDAMDELERLEQEYEIGPYVKALLAVAYSRRKETDKAADLYQEAIGLGRELQPVFTCSRCSSSFGSKWEARCPYCGDWGSAVIELKCGGSGGRSTEAAFHGGGS